MNFNISLKNVLIVSFLGVVALLSPVFAWGGIIETNYGQIGTGLVLFGVSIWGIIKIVRAKEKPKKETVTDEIFVDDDDSIKEINKSWHTFKEFFWILFVVKLVIAYGILGRLELTPELFLLAIAAQAVIVLLMVANMGYFSYKFSGKKLYAINGLWGLLWFGIIFIFIGFSAVMRFKDNQISKRREELKSSTNKHKTK